MHTILIRESNRELAALLGIALPADEWIITTAPEGVYTGLVTEANRPDIILLDLDRANSQEFLHAVREERSVIIALRMDVRDEQEIRALSLGADLVFAKPIALDLLRARLEAIRRLLIRSVEPRPSVYSFAGLTVNLNAPDVRVAGSPLRLTATEHRLLQSLALNSGRIVTHEQLILAIWRDDSRGNQDLVRSFVSSLRQKLRAAGIQDLIETQRQIGYSLPRSEGAGPPG